MYKSATQMSGVWLTIWHFCFQLVVFIPKMFSDCSCHLAPPNIQPYLEPMNTVATKPEGRNGNMRDPLAARPPIK